MDQRTAPWSPSDPASGLSSKSSTKFKSKKSKSIRSSTRRTTRSSAVPSSTSTSADDVGTSSSPDTTSDTETETETVTETKSHLHLDTTSDPSSPDASDIELYSPRIELVSSYSRKRKAVAPPDEDEAPTSPLHHHPHPKPAIQIDPERTYRVYADGIFDMFHFGHALALQQAKQLFPKTILIVGVCSDEDTHRLKGKTVMTEWERAESVRHCKWVDEVVERAPWVLTTEFLDKHAIDFVTHDAAPYADTSGQSSSASDCYKLVKDLGKFWPTERTEGISTSDLINRIVSGYDDYVRRNLLRGFTRKEMNISFLKEKRIKVGHKMKELSREASDQIKKSVDAMEAEMDEIKTKIRDNVEEMSVAVTKWIDNSSRFVDGFLNAFGRDGRLNEYISRQKKRVSDNFSKFAETVPL